MAFTVSQIEGVLKGHLYVSSYFRTFIEHPNYRIIVNYLSGTSSSLVSTAEG